MNWYTCIIHVEDHVSPVQWFHTRAANPGEAELNARRWFLSGEGEMWTPDDIDVPLVFAGKLDPVELPENPLPL
jgi:hypothetical protein